MALTLQDLPIELLDHTLRYLPLSDLLSFARTSKLNYELSTQALISLDLAIFPRKIHSLLAFFDTSNDEGEDSEDETEGSSTSKHWTRFSTRNTTLHQIGLTTPNTTTRPPLSRSNTPPSLPKSKPQHENHHHHHHHHDKLTIPLSTQQQPPHPTAQTLRTHEIATQNTHANTILQTRSLTNLRTLTLRLYDLTSPTLTTTLSTHFPNLHNLTLSLSHPYIHDTTLPAHYWTSTPNTGSPVWNALAGIGDAHASTLSLTSLRSLTLIRANITCAQLRHWIERNPELTSLHLRLCRGVDAEFVDWLATYMTRGTSKGKLRVVRFIECAGLACTRQQLGWIRDLERGGVRELSVRACKGVSEATFWGVVNGEFDDGDDDGGGSEGEMVRIPKLVSPAGVTRRLSRRRKRRGVHAADLGDHDGDGDDEVEVVKRSRLGSVSPALTVSDGMVGTGDFGKIDVDPDLAL